MSWSGVLDQQRPQQAQNSKVQVLRDIVYGFGHYFLLCATNKQVTTHTTLCML